MEQSLSATVNAATDVTYTTADSGGTTGVSVPAAVIPINIVSVNYVAGS